MAPKIENPLVPPGSLVLVTAANGFVATHIVDQLLQYGYRVRGTVRSKSRCSWMPPFFQQHRPDSHLELVEVADISAPGCYDSALNGVSAVIHAAGNTDFSDDPSMISTATSTALNVLKAVKDANSRGEAIKRVVTTSSSWAVCFPQPNVPKRVTSETYDSYASQALEDPKTPAGMRGLLMYAESKKRSEQESWKWYRDNSSDCGFTFNTVMPSTCMGPVLSPKDQPYPSTGGFVRLLYNGESPGLFDALDPQWFVDVRDAARLHVAGAVLADVEGERIFGFAEAYTWVSVKGVVEDEMGKPIPMQLKDKGVDKTTVEPRERSLKLLKKLGLSDWVSFDDSVRANIRSFHPA